MPKLQRSLETLFDYALHRYTLAQSPRAKRFWFSKMDIAGTLLLSSLPIVRH